MLQIDALFYKTKNMIMDVFCFVDGLLISIKIKSVVSSWLLFHIGVNLWKSQNKTSICLVKFRSPFFSSFHHSPSPKATLWYDIDPNQVISDILYKSTSLTH